MRQQLKQARRCNLAVCYALCTYHTVQRQQEPSEPAARTSSVRMDEWLSDDGIATRGRTQRTGRTPPAAKNRPSRRQCATSVAHRRQGDGGEGNGRRHSSCTRSRFNEADDAPLVSYGSPGGGRSVVEPPMQGDVHPDGKSLLSYLRSGGDRPDAQSISDGPRAVAQGRRQADP